MHCYSFIPFLFLSLLLAYSCSNDVEPAEQQPQVVSDSLLIDASNTQYRIQRMGTQLWMMENMRSIRKANPIYTYDYIEPPRDSSGNTRGLLYNYFTAEEMAPKGWRLPTLSDIDSLLHHLGATPENAGLYIKGGNGWRHPKPDGVFALPAAGYAYKVLAGSSTYTFVDSDSMAYLWLAEHDKFGGKNLRFSANSSAMEIEEKVGQVEMYMSVRYVMDSPLSPQEPQDSAEIAIESRRLFFR